MRPAGIALMTIATTLMIACGTGEDPGSGASAASRTVDPTRWFLRQYVDHDGRVVRRDQGGDTVSEGQAYALLLSVASRDRATFARVWRWTRTQLQRGDGLLSWRWKDGRVADRQPAADADLDAARALRLAGARFGVRAYEREAARMARAIRRHETDPAGGLLAGPWAARERWGNPSYASPRAARTLGLPDADGRAVRGLLAGGRLPPDWTREGAPSGPPDTGTPAQYGYDAVRLPARLAESCVAADRRAAAALWPVLSQHAGLLPRGLDGTPAPDAGRHPVALVGAAGAAHAAGARADARRLLRLAAARARAAPTYYGAAWAALGHELLLTRRLGRCS